MVHVYILLKCQVTYIGRKERQLGTLVLEHIQVWVGRQSRERNSGNYVPQCNQIQDLSALAEHFQKSGHVTEKMAALKIVYAS